MNEGGGRDDPDHDGRDPTAEERPDDLGPWTPEILAAMWEQLDAAGTDAEFRAAFAELVRHAGLLTQADRDALAARIAVPFKRRRGRPKNSGLEEAVADALFRMNSSVFRDVRPLRVVVSDLAGRFNTSKENVRQMLARAKRRKAGSRQ